MVALALCCALACGSCAKKPGKILVPGPASAKWPLPPDEPRLVHLGEMSLSEASAHSRQSVGSLKVACHRALKTLKQALGSKGQDHD